MNQKISENILLEIHSTIYPNQEKAIWFKGQNIKVFRKVIESDHFKLPKALKKFLNVIVLNIYEKSVLDESSTYIDLHEILTGLKDAKIGTSSSNISEKFSKLSSLGIFDLVTVDRSNQNLKRIFVLCDSSFLENFVDQPDELKVIEGFPVTNDSMTKKEIKNQFIELSTNSDLMTADITKLLEDDSTFCAYTYKTYLILSSCMRMSSRSNKNFFSAEKRLGNANIRLSAKSDEDYGICTIGDQQIIYTITTLCIYIVRSYVELRAPVSNDFLIDCLDVCRLSGRSGAGSNRTTISNAIHRLYHTVFKIEIDGTQQDKIDVANMIDIAGMDNNNLRFISELNTDLEVKSGNVLKKRNPRWFRISLNQRTFQKILEKETVRFNAIAGSKSIEISNPVFFQADKEILHYSNGLVHLLIQHLNVKIGRSGSNTLSMDARKFHKELAPSSADTTFKRLLLQAFQSLFVKSRKGAASGDWVANGINNIRTLGYFMTVETNQGTIKSAIFRRDNNDKFNGDSSAYKKIKNIKAATRKTDVSKQVSLLLN